MVVAAQLMYTGPPRYDLDSLPAAPSSSGGLGVVAGVGKCAT